MRKRPKIHTCTSLLCINIGINLRQICCVYLFIYIWMYRYNFANKWKYKPLANRRRHESRLGKLMSNESGLQTTPMAHFIGAHNDVTNVKLQIYGCIEQVWVGLFVYRFVSYCMYMLTITIYKLQTFVSIRSFHFVKDLHLI